MAGRRLRAHCLTRPLYGIMKTIDDQGEALTEDEVNDLLDDERYAGWHDEDACDRLR